MTFLFDARSSSSPYVDSIARVQATASGATICRANGRWQLVARRRGHHHDLIISGPITKAVLAPYTEDTEYVFVTFKPGAFIPCLPVRDFVDLEVDLPEGGHHRFWLHGSARELFDYDNVDTFIEHLVREDILQWDTVVEAALQDELPETSFRTVRRRFVHATGMSQGEIRQIERAKQAAALLENGVSILDTVDLAGYADQPHLTRALKRFAGQTPAQILRLNQTAVSEAG